MLTDYNDFSIVPFQKGGAIFQEKAHILSCWMLKKKSIFRKSPDSIRHRIIKLFAQRSFCLPLKVWKIKKSENDLTCPVKLSVNGVNVFLKRKSPGLMIVQGAAGRVFFPPGIMMEVKALACELPIHRGIPLSRFSNADIAREVIKNGIAASISGAAVWRWLSADAIKPWQYRSWIFPRDPEFAEKAGIVLDLYHGKWNGLPLDKNDYVISADEKTSVQARNRKGPSISTRPGKSRRMEFEYERRGALAYIAALDVHRAKIFGICEKTTGIIPYRKLVDLVMQQEPYRSADRVFWITDNGSSHRGETSKRRMANWYPNSIQVHTPVHASWLNQIEIFFSIVQRKVLTPNDFTDLKELERRLMSFQKYYEKLAKPFDWKFSKDDLNRILAKLSNKTTESKCLAA